MTILDRILGHERRALKAARHSSNPSTAGSVGAAKAETGNSDSLTGTARAVAGRSGRAAAPARTLRRVV